MDGQSQKWFTSGAASIGDLVRWLIVLGAFLLVFLFQQDHRPAAWFWFQIEQSMQKAGNSGGEAHAEEIAEKIGLYCDTENEIDFYFNRIFLRSRYVDSLLPGTAVYLHQVKNSFIEQLPNVSREFLIYHQFQTHILEQGYDEIQARSPLGNTPIPLIFSVGFEIRALIEAVHSPTRPRERTLSITECAELLELQLLLHDLRSELFLMRRLADVRVTLGWPASSRAAPPAWPTAQLGRQPAIIMVEDNHYLISENLAGQLYQDSFVQGLEQLLANVRRPDLPPFSLGVTVQNFDFTTHSFLYQGFIEGGKVRLLKTRPSSAAEFDALLAVLREAPGAAAASTDAITQAPIPEAGMQLLKELVRRVQEERSLEEGTSATGLDDDLAQLLAAPAGDRLKIGSVRLALLAERAPAPWSPDALGSPDAASSDDQEHFAFLRFLELQRQRERLIANSLQKLNSAPGPNAQSLNPSQAMREMNKLLITLGIHSRK